MHALEDLQYGLERTAMCTVVKGLITCFVTLNPFISFISFMNSFIHHETVHETSVS